MLIGSIRMAQENIRNHLDNLSFLVVMAGVLLIPLLPIGTFISVTGWAYQSIFIFHTIFLLAAAAYSLRYIVRESGRNLFNLISVGVPFLVLFAFIIFQTILPITAKDALIHHLYLPKVWLESGKLEEIGWHEWSYYPQLIQLAYTGLMSLDLLQLSSLYHATYLVILAGVTAIFIERGLDSRRYGIWAYLVTLSTPMFLRLSGEPLVDLPLALFCSTALALLIEACESRFAGQRLLGAGVLIGLALSTKLNGLLWGVIVLGSFPFYCWRLKVSPKSIIRMLLILFTLALATYSPWLVRNYSWKGNPVYPMFSGHIMDSSSPSKVLTKSISPLAQRFILYDESLADVLAMPFRMILIGQDENPARFDGVLTPLFLLIFIGLAAASFRSWTGWIAFILVVYFLLAIGLTGARIRYLLPIWIPAIGLTFLGLTHLKKMFPRFGILAKRLALGIHAISALIYMFDFSESKGAYKFIAGAQQTEEYLAEHITEYALITRVNEKTTSDRAGRIYLLGTGNRFFYFKNPTIGSHRSEQYLLEAFLKSDTPQGLVEWFKARGVHFILVNRVKADLLLATALTEDQKAIWQRFIIEGLTEKFSQGDYSFFALR
jgi:hypothetical protein